MKTHLKRLWSRCGLFLFHCSFAPALCGSLFGQAPAPEPLVASETTANTIRLSWNDIYSDEDGFRVERYNDMFGSYVPIATVASNVTTFLDTGLMSGNFYFYRVVAFNSGGDSYAASVYAQATPVPAPEPLVVQYTTANTVALSWSDIYNNEDGFRVERYDWMFGNYVAVATVESNVTTFLDTGLMRSDEYSVGVVAFNSGGDSYAAFVSAQATPIPAPEPLVVQYTTANTIALSWSDIYNNEDGFRVERYDWMFGTYVTIATLESNVTTFLDTGLMQGNINKYRSIRLISSRAAYTAF